MLAMVVFAVTDEQNSARLQPDWLQCSSGFLTVYILAPILGAVAGSGLYLHVLRSPRPSSDGREDPIQG